MAAQARKKARQSLGRLKALGPQEPWQVAFFLPKGWDNATCPIDDFASPLLCDGIRVFIRGRLSGQPQVNWGQDGRPRLSAFVADRSGRRIGLTVFGDSRGFKQQLLAAADDLLLYGEISEFDNKLYLRNPEIVDPFWIGRLRPEYPGKPRVISPNTVRKVVLSHLREALEPASAWLMETLEMSEAELLRVAGCPDMSLRLLIKQAHLPLSYDDGERAILGLERLAALGIARAAFQARRKDIVASWHSPANWRRRLSELPFTLSSDQLQATEEIVRDLAKPQPMHRVLSGDVGTGKTVVYGLAAAACIDGGGRVALILPNYALARQVASEFASWWPDIAPAFIASGAGPDAAVEDPFVVGTTALLHRPIGRRDLVIVDEQQRFSREQREQLVAEDTHLLEATATCVPRTQALMQYGAVGLSRLRHRHVERTIETRIWTAAEGRALFKAVKESVARGEQVLVVYPKRDLKDGDDLNEMKKSAAAAYHLWDRKFPGRVRLAHGAQSNEEKNAAVEAMKAGEADILVATTVVEVGLNIPGLRRVVVVHPERLSLTVLHQIRGRAARTGGRGYFDLYLPEEVSEDSLERLKVLVRCDDGFEIAEVDLKLRGFGDLSRESERQHGADETFLFGRPLSVERLEEMIAHVQQTEAATTAKEEKRMR